MIDDEDVLLQKQILSYCYARGIRQTTSIVNASIVYVTQSRSKDQNTRRIQYV